MGSLPRRKFRGNNELYEFIKEELSELQKETGCPDSFIYDFIGKIQNEWHPESCHSIVRNKKRKN